MGAPRVMPRPFGSSPESLNPFGALHNPARKRLGRSGKRSVRKASALRNLLGPTRLQLATPDIGRPFYRAVTTLDALALIEEPPPAGGGRFEFFAKVETAGIEPASAIA